MSVIDSGVISAGRPRRVVADVAVRGSVAIVTLLLVIVILLPVYGSLTIDASFAARLAIVGLFCITLVRPEDGLLLCGAFGPLGSAVGAVLGSPVSVREPFVLAFLAAWLVRGTGRRATPVDSATRRLVVPALLFGALGLASLLVQLAVQQVFEGYPLAFAGRVLAQLAGRYVAGDSYPGLAAGALLLEGIGLFTATVTLCRRHPALARRLVAMATVGAAGAAAISVYRLTEISLRSPAFLETILVQPRNIRISLPFPDVNAAGSYLAMMLFTAGGLAVARPGRRWAWGGVAALITAALWLTGSRTAWASVVLAGTITFAWILPRSRRARILALVPIAVALLFVGLALILPTGRATASEEMSRAVVSRLALGRAGLQMTLSHPILGVGIGRFLPESAKYLDPAFVQDYYARENAHNNFLQILAELGIVGLALFVWFLAAIGRHIARSSRIHADFLLAGTVSGVVAFLLSCLTGHPLLVPEVAQAFSVMLGAAAALASSPGGREGAGTPGVDDPSRTSRAFEVPGHAAAEGAARGQWALVAGLLLIAVSVPVRAHWLLDRETDLRQAAIGFSGWNTDPDGARYRSMSGRAQFYVPADTCSLRFGYRVAPGDKRPIADVELRVDGTVADRVRASRHAWREVGLVFHAGARPGFRRIELRTVTAPDVELLVGAAQLSDCRSRPAPSR